jgi:hypothetical protein
VNAGGDPGRDEYGLPPVDIEVPDDARDLDRDVQAYHRELRSLRRRRMVRRLCRPLARDGMVLPLLAGCLALTLLAATLLTVFTARQATVSLRPGAAPRGPAPTSALLNTILYASGQPVPLRDLPGGPLLVLALVPPRCHCLAGLHALTVKAAAAQIYLVGVRGNRVDALPHELGLGAEHAVDDTAHALPARYQVARLTAVLVTVDGKRLRIVGAQGHWLQIPGYVREMSPPGTAEPAPPGQSPAPARNRMTPAAAGSPAA